MSATYTRLTVKGSHSWECGKGEPVASLKASAFPDGTKAAVLAKPIQRWTARKGQWVAPGPNGSEVTCAAIEASAHAGADVTVQVTTPTPAKSAPAHVPKPVKDDAP